MERFLPVALPADGLNDSRFMRLQGFKKAAEEGAVLLVEALCHLIDVEGVGLNLEDFICPVRRAPECVKQVKVRPCRILPVDGHPEGLDGDLAGVRVHRPDVNEGEMTPVGRRDEQQVDLG